MLLVGWQEGHPACKKLWVVGCWSGYLSGVRCVCACVLSRLTQPFILSGSIFVHSCRPNRQSMPHYAIIDSALLHFLSMKYKSNASKLQHLPKEWQRKLQKHMKQYFVHERQSFHNGAQPTQSLHGIMWDSTHCLIMQVIFTVLSGRSAKISKK